MYLFLFLLPFLQPGPQTIVDRFEPPSGYKRVITEDHSFENYLQCLPLREVGAKVRYYDGRVKNRSGVYAAVIDMDVGNRDLQQCADAVMRLRAEYLWKEERYNDIAFHFTNGFHAPYRNWRNGQRIKVNGNTVTWRSGYAADKSYQQFRKYLNMIFAYASTISLEKELEEKEIVDLGNWRCICTKRIAGPCGNCGR